MKQSQENTESLEVNYGGIRTAVSGLNVDIPSPRH